MRLTFHYLKVIPPGRMKNLLRLARPLYLKKPGSLGLGNTLSPPDVKTTEAMLGLSSGCCCMHKRLIWIHLMTSDRFHDFSGNPSTNSNSYRTQIIK
jgi:hypothetical protein